VKVVPRSRLLSDAAEILEPFHDEVVVVGATALEVTLAASADSVVVTPTRDVDVVVPIEHVATVVSRLEEANMDPSDLAHERGFTWIRGDLKVQLVRTYHPFPKSHARALPANPVFGMASESVHQIAVAFGDEPAVPRFKCANAACLLALKQAAFGRVREPDGRPVERDFHDAYLLLSATPDVVAADLATAGYEVRRRVRDAVAQLAAGDEATAAAGRQMVRLDVADSRRLAEAAVRRAAVRMQRRLDRREDRNAPRART
jgi:hypothetical protein